MTRERLKVDGMHCDGCERNVAFALLALNGITEVAADHAAGHVDVDFDPGRVALDDVRRALEDIGYEVV